MAKFKRKPVSDEIEAYQVTRHMVESFLLYGARLPDGLRQARASYNLKRGTVNYDACVFLVKTIHGKETDVVIGDWVITELDGKHHYPCKPNIFEMTYMKTK